MVILSTFYKLLLKPFPEKTTKVIIMQIDVENIKFMIM